GNGGMGGVAPSTGPSMGILPAGGVGGPG
ncbi:hypothetical protein LDE44_09720, partial [Mycobacterium tuberculosis]